MDFINILDYIGVGVFSISGATIAIKKGLDLFGVYILSFVTAMGGGVLRDAIMKRSIPSLFTSYTAIFIVLICSTITIILKGGIKWHRTIFILDAIGLAVFSINTAVSSIDSGYNLPSVLFMSVITAVGGGVLRDVLCQRTPVILVEDIYATASLLGTLGFWLIKPYFGNKVSMYTAMIFIIVLRCLTYKANLNLPKFNEKKDEYEQI